MKEEIRLSQEILSFLLELEPMLIYSEETIALNPLTQRWIPKLIASEAVMENWKGYRFYRRNHRYTLHS